MKLLVLSDLHVEFVPFFTDPGDADVVILAGDIHLGVRAIEWARQTFPGRPVVQIAGNHEFYRGSRAAILDSMRETARKLEVHLLDMDAIQIDGVRFLGCTLWTDYRLFDRDGLPVQADQDAAMLACQPVLTDFRAIGRDDNPERPITPQHTADWHRQQLHWLSAALAEPHPGPTVVISHMAPSWLSVAPRYTEDVVSAGFASHLDHLVSQSSLWIHGHTHSSFDYRVGNHPDRGRVVCNPRGYLYRNGQWENPQFDPRLIIEVNR